MKQLKLLRIKLVEFFLIFNHNLIYIKTFTKVLSALFYKHRVAKKYAINIMQLKLFRSAILNVLAVSLVMNSCICIFSI